MQEFYCNICLCDLHDNNKVYIKLKNQGEYYKPICKNCADYMRKHLKSDLYDIKTSNPNKNKGE